MAKNLPYMVIDGSTKLIPTQERRDGVIASVSGWASLAIGIVGASFMWLPMVLTGPEHLLFVFGLGGFAASLGAAASLGLIVERDKLGQEIVGFYGMLVGSGAVIMALTIYVLAQHILR
ncbi:MAG: hypothetical protein V1934_08600 [Methanobacteriota archaeon]